MHEISAEEFVRRLKASITTTDTRFAFFIGSGCSRSSGIPIAGELVKAHWLPQLRLLRAPKVSVAEQDKWAAKQIDGYDPDKPAASYGAVIEQLFLTQGERQVEIERLCDRKFPRFGYATLAALIARSDGSFNVALTTNFDDLISDALYLFTSSRPLVIQHESLSEFIRPTRTRPLVVKLHGDHRLSPLNTAEETGRLKENINRAVKALLQDRGLIFLGYGGADQGILTMLGELTDQALPFGVFWVSNRRPEGNMGDWLERRKGTWVEHDDFDKLMMLMRSEFGLPNPDANRINAVFKLYTDDYDQLTNEIARLGDTKPEDLALKEAARRTDAMFKGPWGPLLEGRRLRNSDPVGAKAVYESGVEQFPDFLPLVSDYAIFLSPRDGTRAEEFHNRALKLAPNDPVVISNYATFLANEKGDLDSAETLFLRAIELDPNRTIPQTSYANFLWEKRRDFEKAGQYLQQAMEVDPYNPQALGSYAGFLAFQGRDTEQAKQLFVRALAIDPNNAHNLANLAGLLLAAGDEEMGLVQLSRAIEVLPTSNDTRLNVEVWFYAYAHELEASRASALSELRRLLEEGYRSPGWDLSMNVKRACEHKHPECDWLGPLAGVISENADIGILDEWPAWKTAGISSQAA